MTTPKSVEKAATVEIAAMPAPVATSTLAATAIELARRLDGDPTDREAATIARELRIAMADLGRLAAAVQQEGGFDVSAGTMGH